jgi:hypothetical protein
MLKIRCKQKWESLKKFSKKIEMLLLNTMLKMLTQKSIAPTYKESPQRQLKMLEIAISMMIFALPINRE